MVHRTIYVSFLFRCVAAEFYIDNLKKKCQMFYSFQADKKVTSEGITVMTECVNRKPFFI